MVEIDLITDIPDYVERAADAMMERIQEIAPHPSDFVATLGLFGEEYRVQVEVIGIGLTFYAESRSHLWTQAFDSVEESIQKQIDAWRRSQPPREAPFAYPEAA